MQKIVIIFLTATTVVLGFVCAAQYRQLRSSAEQVRAVEAARAVEADARAAESTRLKELERTNRQLDEQVQKFTAVTTELRTSEARQASNMMAMAAQLTGAGRNSAQSAAAHSGKAGGAMGNEMGDMLGKMMKDPTMREMMREQQKTMINMMYAGLFKEMNLSPEEKDRLKELLTESQMANVEHASGIFGTSETSPETAAKAHQQIAEARKQSEEKIREMLGDERYAQFDDYQKSVGERMLLDQFRNQLASDNHALRDDQAAQMLAIMKEEKTALPPVIPNDQTQIPQKEMFTPDNLERQMSWIKEYNQRVLNRAGQVLTPAQLQQYDAFQKQQASMQELGLKMAGQMFGGQKVEAPAAPVAVPTP